jgi:diguanylate cyclase (GGDEF)-like protein
MDWDFAVLARVSGAETLPNPGQGVEQPAAPASSTEVPACDWDSLFQAVLCRLTQVVGHEAAFDVRSQVLDCVSALGQLGELLTRERACQRQQALELFAARTALAKARVEIVGIRSNERRSRRLALHDELTTLPNRSFFGEWLDHTLAQFDPQQQPLAVLYLDLDGFKPINDAHGHDVGDELLRIVASRLARAVRAEDVVSRLGGDEFACALTNLPGRDHLCHLARKLFETVSAPVKIGPYEVVVRPSIGIAMCPADGSTADTLLRNADAAMYHAKRQGSGFAFFDESHAASLRAQASLHPFVGR